MSLLAVAGRVLRFLFENTRLVDVIKATPAAAWLGFFCNWIGCAKFDSLGMLECSLTVGDTVSLETNSPTFDRILDQG